MFTGIVQELGTVIGLEPRGDLARLTVSGPQTASHARPLDSIAVNGVCLTVVKVERSALAFEVIRTTQRLTTLGALRRGDGVHLEPSLRLADRIGGHLLFGHVDGTGRVLARRQLHGELILTIRVERALRRFLIARGAVAVDGVSLTVGRLSGRSGFAVHLIPETVRRTVLSLRPVGSRVNIELDYFAKLVAQFMASRNIPASWY